MPDELPVKKKIRNYSFQNSRRLPPDKMTEVNGIKVPSMPGSCYHAIICALAQNKNKFCSWERIIELTEKYMIQYGGSAVWTKFRDKGGVKGYKQRIKDNTHTLTRTGKDCYGHRLHEMGMCIYFFKDGSILYSHGTFAQEGDLYNVVFPDGRKLQTRYRGTTMNYNEYKKFLDENYIDITGKILDHESIKDYRAGLNISPGWKTANVEQPRTENIQVCVTLSETRGPDTANRLEQMGLVVEQTLENELVGIMPSNRFSDLRRDQDVIDAIALEA